MKPMILDSKFNLMGTLSAKATMATLMQIKTSYRYQIKEMHFLLLDLKWLMPKMVHLSRCIEHNKNEIGAWMSLWSRTRRNRSLVMITKIIISLTLTGLVKF